MRAFVLCVGVLLFVGVGSIFWFVDPIYHAVAYQSLSDRLVRDAQAHGPEEIVATLAEYVGKRVRSDAPPTSGLASFKYLEYGYASCDSQADILMNLLYYQGISSRVVPLHFADGRSTHTYLEWYNGRDWLIIDPYFNHNIGLTHQDLLGLPKEEVIARTDFTPESYEVYKATLFQQIKETYGQEPLVYFGPLANKKIRISRAFDRLVPTALRIIPSLPRITQQVYIAKHYRSYDLEDRYLVARNHRLLNEDKATTLRIYYSILSSPNLPEKIIREGAFSINRELIHQRLLLMTQT